MSAENQPKSSCLVSHLLTQVLPAETYKRHTLGKRRLTHNPSLILYLHLTRRRALTRMLTLTHMQDHMNLARVMVGRSPENSGEGRAMQPPELRQRQNSVPKRCLQEETQSSWGPRLHCSRAVIDSACGTQSRPPASSAGKPPASLRNPTR